MSQIILPANGWKPREYQMPLWKAMFAGTKRACVTWHRRSGKDEVALHWTAVASQCQRGNYWHMLPQTEQARKVVWNAVNPITGMRRIDEVFPENLRARISDQEMMIRFHNGSTWQVLGSDNYNALVGTPPIGIVFSEWSLSDPSSWAYLRPILLQNGGWALFNFTPRGHNHAKRTFEISTNTDGWFGQMLTVEDTDVFTKEQLEMELEEYICQYGEDLGLAMFNQEYYCSFNAAIRGAYFTREMRLLRSKNRIRPDVDHIPGLPVHTWWDLGVRDPTAIIFVQFDGPRVLIVDFHYSTGAGMDDYADLLETKRREHKWVYGVHIGPHELNNRQVLNARGTQSIDRARELGIEFKVADRVATQESVQAVRAMLPRCHINSERCADLVSALDQYHAEYNDKTRAYGFKPVHDWTSHPVDAFKYGAGMPPYVYESDEWGAGNYYPDPVSNNPLHPHALPLRQQQRQRDPRHAQLLEELDRCTI